MTRPLRVLKNTNDRYEY